LGDRSSHRTYVLYCVGSLCDGQWRPSCSTSPYALCARRRLSNPFRPSFLRATFIVDPSNVIQHITVNNLDVGRSPEETLRVLDALQTGELCPCNRAIGGETL